jgi:hypothetical protein
MQKDVTDAKIAHNKQPKPYILHPSSVRKIRNQNKIEYTPII